MKRDDQQAAEEPTYEQCPYCGDFHPTGTSEQCPQKPKAAWNHQRALEDYTELMRRVRVGAYVELEMDGSFPPDDGTPESSTLESLHNLEELAARDGLEFVGNEQGGYSLEPMSDATKAARREAQEYQDTQHYMEHHYEGGE